jgi:DNA-binding response OmpR family regulator
MTLFLLKPFGRKSFKETLEKAVLELDDRHFVDLGESFQWNSSKHELFCRGVQVKLTLREKELLTLLGSKPGRVFTSYTIELYLWPLGLDDDTSPRIKALIKRIRKKLPDGCFDI